MTSIILYLPLSAGQSELEKVEYNIYEKAVSESALGIFTFHGQSSKTAFIIKIMCG